MQRANKKRNQVASLDLKKNEERKKEQKGIRCEERTEVARSEFDLVKKSNFGKNLLRR